MTARIETPDGDLLAARVPADRALRVVAALALWCGPVMLVAGGRRYRCRLTDGACQAAVISGPGQESGARPPDSDSNASERSEATSGAPGRETAAASLSGPCDGGLS